MLNCFEFSQKFPKLITQFKAMRKGYTSGEKDVIMKIKEDFNFLKNIEYIEKIINSLPYLGAILNTKCQVVFANDNLLKILDLKAVEDILGQRPGEMLHCINANKETDGCGASVNCSVCGVVSCILEAQRTNQMIVKECRITSKIGDSFKAFDFRVTTTPLQWNEETFYLFSLIDISSEKRRKALEKIFFHDVMNKTGSLFGFIELMKSETDIDKIKEFVDFLKIITRDLTDEIINQRDLSAAESGDLKIRPESNNSIDIITSSADQMRSHDVTNKKNILLDAKSDSVEFKTDGEILRRILINMLKNALEATPAEGDVCIGCNSENKTLIFWVHNNAFIPEKDQLQIFQRSFSTKGVNRGLGTYSMKLLGENYLKGSVGFESNMNKGTIFYIKFSK